MVLLMMGMIYSTFAIGTMASLLAENDKTHSKLKHKFSVLEQIAAEYNLNKSLTMRLRKTLREEIFKDDSDKYELLEGLPPKEKAELTACMNKEISSKFDLFSIMSKKVQVFLFPLLIPKKLTAGEYIYCEGELANCIYFLVKGKAQLVLEKHADAPYITLTESINYPSFYYFFYRFAFRR
jgi:hypothetical protein